MNQRAIICVLGVLAIGLFAIFSIIDVESATPSVYPLDSKPYGVTYPEWTVKWWQWFLAIPQDNHPMNDETGKNCGVNQDNPDVWYLTTTGSGTVVRTCSIPAGKALLVPIAANECSYAEFPNLKSEAELRACAVSGDEVSAIQASIDGVEIKDIRKYRVQSPFFNTTLAENNVFGAPGGPSKAVSDAFVLFLQPLSPGKHELHMSQSTLDNPTTGTQSFAYDVTYHLMVGQNSTKSPGQ